MKYKMVPAVSLTASLIACPAYAEDQSPQSDTGQEVQHDGSSLEEIVVTARKRKEDIQDTPISITALTAAGLEERQMTNIASIDRFAPNVVFNTSSPISGTRSSASVFIRGVGQTDFALSTDPGVGIYLDGVYIARSVGSVLDILDVDQIEVLRGPQGTLFGRNTIGGAINITSKRPDQDFHAEVNAKTGSYNRLDVKALVNIPLTDTLASSFSVARFGSDGYIDRPYLGDKTGGDDREAWRGALAWTPSSTFRFDLSVDGTHVREKSCCGELVAVYNGVLAQFYNAAIAPHWVPTSGSAAYFNQNSLPNRPYVDDSGVAVPSDLNLWGISGVAELNLTDQITARSITAYRNLDSLNGRDEDHTPLLIGQTSDIYNSEQFSQEFQLLGKLLNNRFSWILGAYYFDETGYNRDDVDFSIVHLISGGDSHNNSLAFFGQSTLDLTDWLSLTGGLRWTRDTKGFDVPSSLQYVVSDPADVPSTLHSGPLVPGDRLLPVGEWSTRSNRSTPYVNLSYRWTPKLMTYVSYSEGFKGGGFDQRVFPDQASLTPFAPESVKVYEGGFKLEADNQRVRLNGAVFRTDYTNLQVAVFNGIAPVTENAAAALIEGAELELNAVPVDHLMLDLGAGYLNARYTQVNSDATQITLSDHLVYTPRWNINFGPSYEFRLGNIGHLTVRSDVSYRTTVYNDAANTPALIQPSYATVGASAAWTSRDKSWQVILGGTNLTNKRYIISGFADPEVQSIAEASFGRPAEWSLTVDHRF